MGLKFRSILKIPVECAGKLCVLYMVFVTFFKSVAGMKLLIKLFFHSR